MADIGITSNRVSIHFNAIPSSGPGNTGLAAQINSNFECRDPLDDNNPNKGEDIEYEKEKNLDSFNQINLPESESQDEPKSDLSFSVASSSKEPIEDSYSVWLPSAIKSEPFDSEERESESEDENLMFNEGKEEKMDEESDLEGEDDSEGGAYHLAEVSYGEDDEQGPANREDEESDAILGINSDSSGFPLDYSISESEMRMDVFKNGSNSRFLTYLCRVCGHRALGKDLFLDHVQRHGELFGLQPLDRRPYRRIKHPDRLYLGCVICEYKSNSKDSLTKHLLESHSSEFSFCCPDCEFTTDKYYRLRSHVRKHNPIYACSLCPYKTGRVHYLKEHYRVHTKEKPYACNECSFRCASKNSLGKHMRVHTGETPYECKLCERKFKQSGHLTEHMRQHTGEKPFKCHICDYRCAYRGLINKHIRSHSDERPFACTVCDFSCKARYTLTSHMRSHTGEKAYRCKLCDFQCNSRSTFRDHEYKHNGKVLPYECDICNTRFVRERALKRHIMVHDKQPNSLSCNVCGMLFLSRIKLQDHYTTHPRPKPS